MWFIPLLFLGAFVVAVSRSPRGTAPPRQLPSPGISGWPPGMPRPIAVLAAVLRSGQYPPPLLILCAIAEAESMGRGDLASDIVQAFVAPVVYRHQREQSQRRGARGTGAYERGSCSLLGPARNQGLQAHGTCSRPAQVPQGQVSCSVRESCAPTAPRAPFYGYEAWRAQVPHGYGAEVPHETGVPASPAAQDSYGGEVSQPQTSSSAVPETSAAPSHGGEGNGPTFPPMPHGSPGAPAQGAAQSPSEDEIFAMLHTDPGAFLDMVSAQPQRRGPLVEIFPVGFRPSTSAASVPPSSSTAGPQMDLPPETVSQMQYAAAAADQMRAMEPGSPIPGVLDDAWRQFAALLARESPAFSSSRHVGQYRQRRERLAEFGVDPQLIQGSAAAQRQALDTDLADAYRHAAAGGLLEYLGRPIVIPGREGSAPVTLSGVLGVIQCAGLDGALGWLEQPNDRKRYPHTTQAFLRTNGVF